MLARIGREREQHSQNIGIGAERLELGGAVIAGDTVERLGRAAPASNLIAKRLERLCGGRTQHAEPHHSDADILRGRLGKVLPDFPRLQLAELGHAAMMVEHVDPMYSTIRPVRSGSTKRTSGT